MGTFFVEVLLAGSRDPRTTHPLKLLVDTGSTYTWIAGTTLRALGIEPTEPRRVMTIEGRITERPAAEALITLEGRTLHTLCLFGESGDLEVLGAYTLEGFGLAVDPAQRRLIPALLYGAAGRPPGSSSAATPPARAGSGRSAPPSARRLRGAGR